ncbi:hypothetical protein CEXT_127481 [Caerostris extrusa]|uniref:Uncharacterized protein n=1 Tax=Caerostris extrusa TaxID=172846 RepID=A0AAV4Y312_CAEEX|nr:hypothetical protein CEXT_127481 [Caerostris extrusa]
MNTNICGRSPKMDEIWLYGSQLSLWIHLKLVGYATMSFKKDLIKAVRSVTGFRYLATLSKANYRLIELPEHTFEVEGEQP